MNMIPMRMRNTQKGRITRGFVNLSRIRVLGDNLRQHKRAQLQVIELQRIFALYRHDVVLMV